MTTETVIRTEGLAKRYGRVQALTDLDLEVRRGEVFGFLGPNGAGKTTTIRLLLDLLRPTAGRIEVLGRDPREGLALRRHIGYLPGELPPLGRQNAEQLLRFLGNLSGGVDHTRMHGLAERLELDLRRPVRTLSKGNRQKVGLVQAFMHDPDLLILDEPTSGLDPLLQQEFLAMVREARGRGTTVFMSSHVLAEVEDTADRVGVLRDGHLVAVEDVGTLRERAVRQVEIRFDVPVDPRDFAGLPDVRDVVVDRTMLRCTVAGSADALVKAAARFPVVTLRSREPDLEETFLTYYGNRERAGHVA